MLLRYYQTILIFSFWKNVISQSYNDVFCRRVWYFNTPRPAPIRCPTPSFFTYYDCCGDFQSECCWHIRPEPIYVLVAMIVAILFCCCFCALSWLFMMFRRRKEAPDEKPVKKVEVSTVDSGIQADVPSDKRRSYVAARDREFDYQYFT
ncbi:unnamed protein product [Caenorhabditis bovis]|uniref:Uncharacterized protein n=1 Tax=Caenorhabditis bovis TaxID=2654633 RepID=A0A8S1EMC3_9PELO|nr:unnamed protein product [Caenorhabditis bovis]